MKLNGKKKRLLALMMCLLMVATLFQGNGYSALADVTGGVGAPSGEMATAGDAEEMGSISEENLSASEEEIILQTESNIGNFLDIVTSAVLTSPTNTSTADINAEYVVKMNFTLPDDSVKPISENYIYTFELSDIFAQKAASTEEIRDLINSDASSTPEPMPIMMNNSVVGYYTINAGKVTLDFSVGIDTLRGNRTGDFTFGCKLDEDKIADDGGEYKLKYGTTPGTEITTITFKPKEVLNPGITVEKSAAAYDSTTGYFNYTITVTNNGSEAASNVIITDILGKSLEMITSTVSGADAVGVPSAGENDTTVTTFTIASIAVGETRTITYSCKPTEAAIVGANNSWGNGDGVSNKITAKANGDDRPIYIDENKSQTEQTVYSTIKKDVLYKAQSTDTTNETVTWTIVVNNGETVFNLNGYTLSDVMETGLTIDGDVTVTGGDDATNAAIALAIKSGGTYTFRDTTDTFTITYTTSVDVPTAGEKTYKNTAKITNGTYTDTAEATSGKFGSGYSSKVYSGDVNTPPIDTAVGSATEGQLILPWTSTTTVPDTATKYVYTDSIYPQDKGLGFVESSFDLKYLDIDDTYKTVDSLYYSKEFKEVSWANNGVTNEYQLVVTLTEAGLNTLKGKTLQIKYDTIGDYKDRYKDDNNNRYTNKYTVDFGVLTENGEAYVEYPYVNNKFISKTVAKADSNNGTITWCVEIDASNMQNLVLTDTIEDMMYCGYKKGKWTDGIVEVDSSNAVAFVEFKKDSQYSDYLVGMNIVQVPGSTTEHPKYTFTIDFNNAGITPNQTYYPSTFITTNENGDKVINGTLYIYYTTKPEGIEASYNHTGSYQNDATISFGEQNNLTQQSDSAVGELDTKVLSKSSTQNAADGNNVLTYILDVNSAGINLTEQGSFYVVEDELPSKLVYRTTGTTVVNSKTGDVLAKAATAAEVKSDTTKTKYHVAYANNVLTFTVPDGVPLKITYKTTMLAGVGDTATYVNSAKIAAPYVSNESYSSDSQNRQVTYSAANITSSIFTVEKVNAEDLSEHLKNAEFSIKEYTYDTNSSGWVESNTYSAKTDSDGKLYAYTQKSIDENTGGLEDAISDANEVPIAFTSNKIYEIRETAAPDGYALTSQYYKVIVVDKDDSTYNYNGNIPADTTSIVEGTNLLFTNIPTNQDNKLIIDKQYYEADGTTPVFPTAKADIKIYAQELTLEQCSSGNYTPLVVGNQGGGFKYEEAFDTATQKHTITLTAIPNGTYTVYEAAAPDGYETIGKVYHFKVVNDKVCWDTDDTSNTEYELTATGTIKNKKVFENSFTINKLYYLPGADTTSDSSAMQVLAANQEKAEFTCTSVATGITTSMNTVDGFTYKIENLAAGVYTIDETASEVYNTVDSLLPLTITVYDNGSMTIKDKNGDKVDATLDEMINALQNRTYTVKNQLKDNEITIHKSYYDANGNVITIADLDTGKASFKLYKKNLGSWVQAVAGTDYSVAEGPTSASGTVDDYTWSTIVPGEYKIVESMTANDPSKYEPFTDILFKVDDNYQIQLAGEGATYSAETAVINRKLSDQSCRFYITKYLSNQTGSTAISGASDVSFEIKKADGSDVTDWKDENGIVQSTPATFKYNTSKNRFEVTGLQAGSYKVNETGTKAGYVLAKEITFDVSTGSDGKLTVTNLKYGGNDISASGDIIASTISEDGTQTVVASLINRPYENKITIDKAYYQPNGTTAVASQSEKAAFTLYRKNGGTETLVKTIAGSSTDSYEFNKLEPGDYVIKESTVPAGYTPCTDIEFTVNDDYSISVTTATGESIADITYTSTNGVYYEASVDVKNVLSNSFKLTKKYTYANGTEVTDAMQLNTLWTETTFKVYDASSTEVTTGVTWVDGLLSINNLNDGTYTIKETDTPSGFVASGDIALTVTNGNISVSYAGQSVDFTNLVNNNKMNVTATLYNRQQSNQLVITKEYTDADGTPIALANVTTKASFTIRNSTNEVMTGTADASTGKYTYKNLLPGTYTITESAPAGYVGVPQLSFTVGIDGVISIGSASSPWTVDTNYALAVSLTAVNKFKENKISLRKRYVDDDGHEIALANITTPATFKISNVSGTVDNTMTYNSATGIYTYEKLLPGVYKIEETVPSGYEAVGSITVTVGADGTIKSTYSGADSSIFSVSGDGTLTGSVITFTNKQMPDNSVTVYKKYVSSNGVTLQIGTDVTSADGELAVFKLYQIVGASENEITSSGHIAVDPETGVYTFKNLDAGNYKIVETVGAGFTAVSDITFVVNSDRTISNLNKTALANSTNTNKYVEVTNTRDTFNNELELTKTFINQGGVEITGSAYDTLFNEVEFKMYDSANNVISAFTKDTVSKSWKVSALEPGVYTIKETVTPAEYISAGDIVVTVTKTAPRQSKISVTYSGQSQNDCTVQGNQTESVQVKLDNHQRVSNKIVIEKKFFDAYGQEITNVSRDEYLRNTSFKYHAVGSNTEYPIAYSSSESGYVIENLQTGAYIIEETADDDFNAISEIKVVVNTDGTVDVHYDGDAQDISVTYSSGNKTATIIANNYWKTASVNIGKKDLANGEELPGASLKITDKVSGALVDEWTSDTSVHKIPTSSFVANRDYTLTEITAPFGYEIAEEITFRLDESGRVYVNGSTTPVDANTFYMEDAYKYATVSKRDLTLMDELPGATLVITDKAGNTVVDSWKSSDTARRIPITSFEPSKEYLLTEITAPYGYEIAESIMFFFDNSGSLFVKKTDGMYQKLTSENLVMVDGYSYINFSKTDITNGLELPGATIVINDNTGRTVDSWVSTAESHKMKIKDFAKDTDYYFTEVIAPDGYDVAETIIFKIGENNKIYIKNADNTYTALDTNTLVMQDKPKLTTDVTTSDTTTTTTTTTTTSSSQVETGDTAPVRQIFVLMLLSAACLVGLGMLKKRSKKYDR